MTEVIARPDPMPAALARAPWRVTAEQSRNRPRLDMRQAADRLRDYAALLVTRELRDWTDEDIVSAFGGKMDPAHVAAQLVSMLRASRNLTCYPACSGHCLQCAWVEVAEAILADGTADVWKLRDEAEVAEDSDPGEPEHRCSIELGSFTVCGGPEGWYER